MKDYSATSSAFFIPSIYITERGSFLPKDQSTPVKQCCILRCIKSFGELFYCKNLPSPTESRNLTLTLNQHQVIRRPPPNKESGAVTPYLYSVHTTPLQSPPSSTEPSREKSKQPQEESSSEQTLTVTIWMDI